MIRFCVNGQTAVGYWRVDDIAAQLTGIQFLMRPAVLVRERELAERIAKLLNESEPPEPAEGGSNG